MQTSAKSSGKLRCFQVVCFARVLLLDDSVNFPFLDAWLHSITASALSWRQIPSEQISLAGLLSWFDRQRRWIPVNKT